MNRRLPTIMHILALTSIAVVALTTALYYADPYSHDTGSAGFGKSLLYVLLYLCGMVIGFVGWMLSVVVLLKEGRAKTKHAVFATLYIVIGTIGFGWAYYLLFAR